MSLILEIQHKSCLTLKQRRHKYAVYSQSTLFIGRDPVDFIHKHSD